MMQVGPEFSSHKHSLLNVMNRFIAATNNMDETIMVPSLLRDVPLEEQENQDPVVDSSSDNADPASPGKRRDMYEHYLLLKSIKNDMEWGLLKRERSGGASFLEMAVKQEEPAPPLEGLELRRATNMQVASCQTCPSRPCPTIVPDRDISHVKPVNPLE
uniref:MID1 interacting protein 1, like n=1 Tax=Scleropages formosus TaxID=113540 RepID=A0A8C9W1Z2_SCLFO